MNPNYSLHHPRWHRRRIPIFWWLKKLAYTKFILRELTSLAVVYVAVLLLAQIWTLSRGEEAHQRFVALLELPAALAFHVFVLLGVLFHTVTWLNLAPKALVLRLGGRRLPDLAIVLGHYLAWLAVSALLVWLLVGR